MNDAKNEFEYTQTPWDKWIYDGIDFGIDACQAFLDFWCFVGEWKQKQLLETLASGCCEPLRDTGTVLRFRLMDGWYVSCDTDTGKVQCFANGTVWACLDLPCSAKENLAEMLRQLRQENYA